MASEETDLPQPELAHDGDHFAAVDGVGNAIDRAHDAARRVELDMQVLNLKQRRFRPVWRLIVRQRSHPGP